MKPCILVAIHDRGLSEVIQHCLASHGYYAVVAANGIQCLEELRTLSPVVLVLDPQILWGGAGVIESLVQEVPLTPPIMVVFDGPSGCRIPDRLHSRIDHWVHRPSSLIDLLPFVHQIETLIPASDVSCGESGSLSSSFVASV